jgi:hypothetical protein
VAVEKGTKAVISMSFSFCGGRTFNNLRVSFSPTNCQKEFFNSHKCFVNGSRPDFWRKGFSHFPHRRREGFWNAVSMSDLNETG